MNKELFLNNEYVNDLCSNESIEEVIPYLLSLLPISEIPCTKKSDKLVESLRQDSDSIHAFISKMCVKDKDASIDKNTLYEAYAQFCINSGRECHKKHGFMRSMRSIGFSEGRDPKTRQAVWIGLTLKSMKRRKKK